MPKVIIPDKICSHCGGNEWFVSYVKKSNGELRVKYSCMTKVRKANKTFNEKNSETIKLKKLKGGQYHNLTLKREKQNRDNLSDGYVRVRVARSLNKSCKCVTSEEIKNKREELIKMREYKKIPYSERRKEQYKKHHIKRRDTVNDPYVKSVIRNTLRYKIDKLPSSSEISNHDVIKTRASIIAFRKYQKSDSYIKTCIQSAIANSGDKISFSNISKHKVQAYRKGLRMLRYYRELNRLLTIKN